MRRMITFFPSRTVALDFFGLSLHWYGILYVASFAIAALLLPRLQRLRDLDLSREGWLDIVTWAVVGVLAGGRLGFVLFYEPVYFLYAPWKIFYVWEGGMSSHGGFTGVVVALWLFTWMKGLWTWAVADVITVPAAIGLGLGRVGNFINQELYGTQSSLPWTIAVPGALGLRHPLQIYDVLLMLAVACVCYVLLRMGKPKAYGRIFAIFLLLYGIVRFLLEYIRVQTYPLILFGPLALTRGQLLTIPLIVFAAALWFMAPRYTVKSAGASP